MLIDPGPSLLVLLMVAGIALDWLLGEARSWHPLVGFGKVANTIERRCNRGRLRRAKGMLAWMLAVVLPVLIACLLLVQATNMLLAASLHVLLLYFCLGLRSLREHVLPIGQALAQNDVPRARLLTARIVSRDTGEANASELAKAAIESTLENGNDAVFGTLFWFLIAGGPGALLFRLANTLDAMWGYRSQRFLAFGWFAARIDDGLNWIPARLTALSYTLLGDVRRACHCWCTQTQAWPSPNAGPVMSAGAGALGLALGGSAQYDGVVEQRPPLGVGRAAAADDIARAWRMVGNAVALWIVVLAFGAFLLERFAHA
jgi:adenosylcobinamide-phosphate synthase